MPGNMKEERKILLQKYPDGAVDEKRENCADLTNDDRLSVTIRENLGDEFED